MNHRARRKARRRLTEAQGHVRRAIDKLDDIVASPELDSMLKANIGVQVEGLHSLNDSLELWKKYAKNAPEEEKTPEVEFGEYE